MQDAFSIVIVVVVVVAAIVAVVTVAGSGRAYEEIGRGGLDSGPRAAAPVPSADEEARQMLVARNERRARRGQPPLDVDAELAALRGAVADPELEEEVRQLVEARNARRVRHGRSPLDVEAEVARRLRDLAD